MKTEKSKTKASVSTENSSAAKKHNKTAKFNKSDESTAKRTKISKTPKTSKKSVKKAPNLKSFYKNYEGLIEIYDIQNTSALYENEEQILSLLENVKNKEAYLINGLNYAIQNNVTIIDALQSINFLEEDNENAIQRYFRDINSIYEKNDNDYNIEWSDENRDRLIEMNLKTVISIAKKYQGLGLSLDELISAGNLGLCIASERFDASRSRIKNKLITTVESLPDNISSKTLMSSIFPLITYGVYKKKLLDFINSKPMFERIQVINWINKNITDAKFSSVASMWIRAYILIEINNNSRVVRKPKTEILKDKDDENKTVKEKIISIDAPVLSDSNTPLLDIFMTEDDEKNKLEVDDSRDIFKHNLRLLLDNVNARNSGILLKKFGIGLPRPMLPKEIAVQEGLSIARISQILQQTIDAMRENAEKYNIDGDMMFEALTKII